MKTSIVLSGRKPRAGKDMFLSVVRYSGQIIFSSAFIASLKRDGMKEHITIDVDKLGISIMTNDGNILPKFMKNGVFVATDRKTVEYMCAALNIDSDYAKFTILVERADQGVFLLKKDTLRLSVPVQVPIP